MVSLHVGWVERTREDPPHADIIYPGWWVFASTLDPPYMEANHAKTFRVYAVSTADGELVSIADAGVGGSCASNAVVSSKPAAIGNWKLAIPTLRIITPVHVREKIVPRFALGQEILFDVAGSELIVQLIKPRKMVHRSPGSVFTSGAGPHQKRPIA